MFQTKKSLENRCLHLESECATLKTKVSELQRLLNAEMQAKENGCKPGNYCRGCIHAVCVFQSVYCSYNNCAHFEKDPKYIDGTYVLHP
jgi:hypothetical protein